MREFAIKSCRWYLDHVLNQSWTERAACVFHVDLPWTGDHRPPEAHRAAMAAVCAGCPVLTKCAAYALEGYNGRGVEGGFYAGVWVPWPSYYTRTNRKQALEAAQRILAEAAVQ